MKTTHHIAMNERGRCQSCGVRYAKLNLAINSSLAAVKIIVGVLSGSRALVAASLYSINDVLSGIIFMVTLRVGSTPADEDHPYGHGKAEFLAIALMSVVLAVAVFFLMFSSLIDIVRGVSAPPHAVALGVALIALFANGLLAQRGFCAARFFRSPALHTIAEHNHADAYSSAAVLIGVGGTFLGFHVLDQIVAVFEAAHVLWLGGSLLGKSLKGLMDTALPSQQLDEIRQLVRQVDGVVDIAVLRTRQAGSSVFTDLIVTVPQGYTVAQAENVCERVSAALKKFPGVTLNAQVGFRPVAFTADVSMSPLTATVGSHDG